MGVTAGRELSHWPKKKLILGDLIFCSVFLDGYLLKKKKKKKKNFF